MRSNGISKKTLKLIAAILFLGLILVVYFQNVVTIATPQDLKTCYGFESNSWCVGIITVKSVRDTANKKSTVIPEPAVPAPIDEKDATEDEGVDKVLPPIPPEEDFYYCNADSDCVRVKADCCGCEAGGESTAINKKYQQIWEAQKQAECGDVACILVYQCVEDATPSCVNNRCLLPGPNT